MSKKDYVRIAKVMQAARKFTDGKIKPEMDYIETELAALFREDNPAFDAVRFLKACRG
jgi:hypothetical protein